MVWIGNAIQAKAFRKLVANKMHQRNCFVEDLLQSRHVDTIDIPVAEHSFTQEVSKTGPTRTVW